MSGRMIAAMVGATALAVGTVAAAASGAGAPPPPKSTTGAAVNLVASGLHTPTSFAFGAGSIFEGDGGAESSKKAPPNGGVFVLKGGKGVKIAGSPQFVGGLAWRAGTLYVSGGSLTGPTTATWQLLAWSGWNGTTFAHRKVIYTAPKTFGGFNGLAVGPDGRLYVGVDVGLTDGNDHGPAATSPYLYDILSLSTSGGDVKVFAQGMRQPWQFAFPAGSRTPLVSDLAQDDGDAAKTAPDLILNVHQGDDYGFPSCTWTPGSACAGLAKPFAQFAPHTDIMGMRVIGSQLYMTSFAGPDGKGPGGEVLTMSASGGKAMPLVTGFVAPVVGLGAHNGRLYIGELTGQVFQTKP
jgi:glucose/arabinose dehydrogenase